MRRKPPLINKAASPVGLVSDINDLSDVVISGASSDDLLQFNGTNWVNVTEVSDGNVPESAVTQHETALTITEAQISDLSHYTDTDANSAIDARVDQAFVQALSFYTEAEVDAAIASGVVTDHGALTGLADNDHPQYARKSSAEVIGGAWELVNISGYTLDFWTDGNTAGSVHRLRFRDRKNASGQGADGQVMGFMNFERQSSNAATDFSLGLVHNDLGGDAAEVFRIDSSGDTTISGALTVDSTTQVGLTAGSNIIMDNNEIMCRSNGVASTLNLQTDGGVVYIGQNTEASFRLRGPAYFLERAAASTDVVGQGQLWVHNDTPNTLWFTDDAGNDHQMFHYVTSGYKGGGQVYVQSTAPGSPTQGDIWFDTS